MCRQYTQAEERDIKQDFLHTFNDLLFLPLLLPTITITYPNQVLMIFPFGSNVQTTE
jgi:hypothetical protein